MDRETVTRQFDLNIEKVLEHWGMAHAVREVIANALDEQALTDTAEPEIHKDGTGAWHVRDFGRGLRYEHLTQNENKEKLGQPERIIGKFGVGLKDALAAADRRRVGVLIRSAHGDITIGRAGKHGFSDVVILHAHIHPPSDPHLVGTDFMLSGLSDGEMAQAKDFFLHYSGDEVLERNKFGSVLRRKGKKARIYVNGLFVAEEENFLFSYNITSLTASLRKALNRERTNVGRSAYTDRVKAVLLECAGSSVADGLAGDLRDFETGKVHDELQWLDVVIDCSESPVDDRERLNLTLSQASIRAEQQLQGLGYGRRLALEIRTERGDVCGEWAVPAPVGTALEIRRAAGRILGQMRLAAPVTRVRLRVEDVSVPAAHTADLFGARADAVTLEATRRRLAARFGLTTLTFLGKVPRAARERRRAAVREAWRAQA